MAVDVTAARDELVWLLEALRTAPLPDDPALLRPRFVDEVDDPAGVLRWVTGQLGAFTAGEVTDVDANAARVRVTGAKDRLWDLTVIVEEASPRRIQWVRLDRALPDGMEVREATAEDDAAIADVCRSTAIVLRDSAVTIDPGPSYWNAVRLMEHPTVLVATHDGRVVAVHCGVFYPITYGGEPQFMSQILHSRVLSEYAGLGLWSVMNRRLVNNANDHREASARAGSKVFENGCAYFATDNDATRRLNGAQSMWSFSPVRAVLSCAALAAPPSSVEWRAATPSDASRVVSLLNAAHAGEELFAPYTEETLAARLERAPDLYSWGSLLLGERAVVGVWDAGRIHIRRSLEGGEERRSVRGLVLDHGCEPGAADELEALLRVACGRSAAAGMTDLSVFTSTGCRDEALLRGLATEIEQYELSTPYTPEPEGAAARGLYVDQVYF